MEDNNADSIVSASDDVTQILDNTVAQTSNAKDDEFERLLNNFIACETNDTLTIKDIPDVPNTPLSRPQQTPVPAASAAPTGAFGNDESELAQAYENMIGAVTAIASVYELKMPELAFDAQMLIPNYKPSIGRRIITDTLACWDVMFAAFPEKLSDINPNSNDEQFLNFAEGLSDQNLQLAIISYVEILIDIENCEISYEERRLKAQRKRIERALYEEYQRRRERKLRFIEAVSEHNFPIDAERLINNYFKTSSKDPKAAFEILTTNPAMYAPIENDKIKPKMFGLIKVTPEDGIKENHRIGAFLKKLKA